VIVAKSRDGEEDSGQGAGLGGRAPVAKGVVAVDGGAGPGVASWHGGPPCASVCKMIEHMCGGGQGAGVTSGWPIGSRR